MKKLPEKGEKTEQKFLKEALLKSMKYSEDRDLLSALLSDEKLYSHREVINIIEKFKKGSVR